MKSDEILDAIEHIANNPSKNTKESIIANFGFDEDFVKVLSAALNPFITYGISKVQPIEFKHGSEQFDGRTWHLLDRLAKRELSGNTAKFAVQEELIRLTEKSKELLSRIISKDLRAGFSESTVNKAFPGMIPTFDCMLAHKYSDHKHKLTFPLIAEPKLDGVRVLTFVDLTKSSEEISFFSRTGKEFKVFDHLKTPITNMVRRWLANNENDHDISIRWVFDSEVVSGVFNKTVGDVRRKDVQATDAKLAIFDVLPMSVFEQDSKKGSSQAGIYTVRAERLKRLMQCALSDDPVINLPSFLVFSDEEIHDLYEKVRERGLEGLIIKDPNGLYHRRRNHAWSKIKAEESLDLPIIGAFEGEGKYVGMLGGFIVNHSGVDVRVGGGYTDYQRKAFWSAYLEDSKDTSAKKVFIDPELQVLGRLIEVAYHEETPDKSLRHPRFTRFRDDKPATEVRG